MAARGHEAVAIDLPGHGEDHAPPEAVTLQDYADRIIEALRAKEDNPILVGHSSGGFIGPAAEMAPDPIRALVYIAAHLPASGSSMMQTVNGFDPELLAQFQWAPDRRTARFSPEGAREIPVSSLPAGDRRIHLAHAHARTRSPVRNSNSLDGREFRKSSPALHRIPSGQSASHRLAQIHARKPPLQGRVLDAPRLFAKTTSRSGKTASRRRLPCRPR